MAHDIREGDPNRPRKKKSPAPDEGDEERPRKKRPRDDDEDNEEPVRTKKKPSRVNDEEDQEPPRRKRQRARDDEDDIEDIRVSPPVSVGAGILALVSLVLSLIAFLLPIIPGLWLLGLSCGAGSIVMQRKQPPGTIRDRRAVVGVVFALIAMVFQAALYFVIWKDINRF